MSHFWENNFENSTVFFKNFGIFTSAKTENRFRK